jgi:crotonobetaine/carnitine-CoA ligase
LTEAGAAIVICEEDYAARVAAIADRIPAAKRVLVRGKVDETLSGLIRFEELGPHRGQNDSPITARPKPRDPSLLIFTGGTTGPSKGCIISHNQCYVGARRAALQDGGEPGLVRLSALPMFHLNVVAFTILTSAFNGGMAAVGPRFSVSNFWPEVERTGARSAMLLGAMPAMIAKAPDSDAMKRCFGRLRQVPAPRFLPISRKASGHGSASRSWDRTSTA